MSEDPEELLHHPTEKGRSSTSVPGPTEPQVLSDPGRTFPHFGPIVKEKQPEVGKEKQDEVGKESNLRLEKRSNLRLEKKSNLRMKREVT